MNKNQFDPLSELGAGLSRALYTSADEPVAVPLRRRGVPLGMRRSTAFVGGGVALGLAGGGIALAAVVSSGSPVTVSEYNSGTYAQVATAPDATVVSQLSILARAVTPADALPATFVSMRANSLMVKQLGVNLALARRATGPTGFAAWVIPGDSVTCLSVGESNNGQVSGTSCVSNAGVISGKLALTLNGDFVAGVVPDGVSSVTITSSDGSSYVAPVDDNVYAQAVPSGSPASVAFTVAGGRESTTL